MERRDKDIIGYLYNDHDKKLREQIAGEILERLPEYTETEACKRAGFYYDRDDVIAAIARGEK